MTDVGIKLRAARDRKGWSRALLARRSGVNARTIEAYETTDVEPSWSNVSAMARVLEVSLDELAGRTVPKPKVPPEVLELLVELEQTIQRMSRALGGEDDGDTTQGAA